MTLLAILLLLWTAVVATEAYRRTGPPSPRATVVLVITIVLVAMWLLFDVFRLK